MAQVFFDRNNQLVFRSDGTPYGRQLVAKKLDQKLSETFGNNELLIVKQNIHNPTIDENHKLIVSQFSEWLRYLLRIQEIVPIMTYESAIQYFVTNRPEDRRVKKGAMLRQHHPQGYHLAQVFLDRNNQLVHSPDGKPYGRQLVTKELDEELWDTFGDKDLIIVE